MSSGEAERRQEVQPETKRGRFKACKPVWAVPSLGSL